MVIIKAIYAIKNIVNNKIYIGQTKDLGIRWREHINKLKAGTHVNRYLQFAWNKYGSENFEFIVLEEVEDYSNINKLEQEYISRYKANDSRYGYNLTTGGEGYKLSEDVKRRMSINGRGKNTILTYGDVAHIKMAMYCGMDRKEISSMFGVSVKVLTGISMGSVFGYVLPQLNNDIHCAKRKALQERNDYILNLYDNGLKIREIHRKTGYSESIIEKCIYKYRKHTVKYNLRKLTPKQEREIINLRLDCAVPVKELAAKYGVSDSTIRSIIDNYVNTNK